MKKRNGWPYFVVGLLLFGVGTNLIMMVFAVQNPSFSVEKDYYQKAVEWDKVLLQNKQNKTLGWLIAPTLSKSLTTHQATLCIQLQDKEKKSIEGAKVQVTLFHNARASQKQSLPLPFSALRYCGMFEAGKAGLWNFQFRIEKGKTVFTHEIQKNVEPTKS